MIKRVFASIGVIVTASVAYVMLQPETIQVIDDGVMIEHETRADSVLEVLEELNITLDETDYVTPALSEDVPEDRLIRIERSHEVSLQIGYGQTESIQTRERTVEDVLLRYGVTVRDGDTIYPSVRTPVTNGMTIRYQPVVAVNLIVGEDASTIYTMATNVEQLLREEKIDVTERDTVLPDASTPIREGMTVTVNTNRDVVQYESQLIPYDMVEEEDDTLEEGVKQTVQVGVPGLERTRYALTVENGTITNRTKTDVETLRKAIPQVIKVGTKKVTEPVTEPTTADESSPFIPEAEVEIAEPPKTDDVLDFSSAKQLLVEATAYTNNPEDTVTYNGRVLTRSGYDVTDTILFEGMRIIAVDPAIIPLGTRVYVEGIGMAIALDTGSAIKGQKIDIMMDELEEAVTFGRKPLTIWVIPKQEEEKEGTDNA
ncbi:ubiquitin-like domain-containing protein [Exiguobacterium aestuarii]|uniref:Ubiquitin-like domain-containing protein n=1 Tax=Exiguobacterium aestuarii TaxID=273527 RepID=A0ABW2PPC7_9BACL|nr:MULTISPECIES: 3D domain-containing protein [Exiguobacterium]MCT4786952.1 ubiquitin-like domain-containing protein [Exiguobacterium aestuarii]